MGRPPSDHQAPLPAHQQDLPYRTMWAAGLLAPAAAVFVLNLLLRAVNAVQQAALAYVFGPGPELDAYATAVSLPNLLVSLLVLGPLGLALTPILAGASSEAERERAWRVAGTILTLVVIVAAPLVVGGMLVAPF